MAYDRSTFAALLAREGQAALRRAATLPEGLRGLTALRDEFPSDLATLAHLTVSLRRRAAERFTRADAMYFLPEALEQATGEAVAAHKARRFAGRRRVADLGCGIGGDTIALAGVAPVVAVDRDPLRLAIAEANVAAYGLAGRVSFRETSVDDPTIDADAFHLDPVRRRDGKRRSRVDEYEPPPNVIRDVLARVPDGAICIGPMTSDAARLGPDEIEVVSHRGEVRAMTLWYGALATARRRATTLDSGASLTGTGEVAGDDDRGPLGAWIAVPDPALVRAHLVADVARAENLRFLDPRIALLTGEEVDGGSPWTRCYPVVAAFPFSRARCRREFAARGIACVTVSTHGVSIAPRELAPWTRGGPPAARLFVVRTDDGVIAVITETRPGGAR